MNPEDLIENNVYIARCRNSEWDSMFVFKKLCISNTAEIRHRVYLNRLPNHNNVLVNYGGCWSIDTKFEKPSQELIEWFWRCINNNYYYEKPKYNDLIYTTL
jgi:hypothetical protein